MTINHQWSVLWPEFMLATALQHGISLQISQSSSQILISNTKPMAFYSNFIAKNPERCQNTYIKVNLEHNICEKKYRMEVQDKLCFISEEYSHSFSSQVLFEFKSTIKPKANLDFSRYLVDIMVFYQERFSHKFNWTSVFLEIPSFDLKDTLDFFRLGDKQRPLAFSYFPYYYEKQGFPVFKTTFLWKPWVRTLLLADEDFDGRTEVAPGQGVIPNKSACQIANENKKELFLLFKPNTINLVKNTAIERYLQSAEEFIASVGSP